MKSLHESKQQLQDACEIMGGKTEKSDKTLTCTTEHGSISVEENRDGNPEVTTTEYGDGIGRPFTSRSTIENPKRIGIDQLERNIVAETDDAVIEVRGK